MKQSKSILWTALNVTIQEGSVNFAYVKITICTLVTHISSRTHKNNKSFNITFYSYVQFIVFKATAKYRKVSQDVLTIVSTLFGI